jgi:Tol biopolymer transport system component/predicted Ser/Thr protein kinase
MIGKTIAHYHILEKLGEGGMGVVYKARDTHLDRLVAIKVLPAEKVADLERKRRFVQEAKAASALNHPNIITIHDIASANGIDFIVMEYVQGKTLDALVPRKGLRLNETLKLAIQMADALAKAHSAGIIHRDLKPTNVMITDDGLVKVLDFGLAKLTEVSESGDEATRTLEHQTEEGTIVGTVSYMSPEQAEGKKVDARSDIFSFGSVLYEMATGQQAFHGDSKMSTLAAILHKEPKPVSEAKEDVPHDLERIINRCLRKDPSRRFQAMPDLKVALQELKEESDSGTLATTAVPQLARRRGVIWTVGLLALVCVVAVAIWFAHSTSKSPLEAPLAAVPLTSYPGFESGPSFSPDGSQVAFAWTGEKQDNLDIYLKLIGTEPPARLTTDPAPDSSTAWSPDGRSIAFIRRLPGSKAAVFLVPPIGGAERKLAEIDDTLWWSSLAWSPDGKSLAIVVAGSSNEPCGLFLLSIETGEKRRLTSPPSTSIGDSSPAFSPDGRTLAFSRIMALGISDLYLLDLSGRLETIGEPKRLTFDNQDTSDPVWTPDGREIIFSSGQYLNISLWRILAFGSGKPQQLVSLGNPAFHPAISRQGRRLAYERHVFEENIWRVEVPGPNAKGSPPKNFISSTRGESNPNFSPDGKRIVFASDRSGSYEIWACNSDGLKAVQLTSFGGPSNGTPRWSPDSERIAFDSNTDGQYEVYVINANGSKPQRLTSNPSTDAAPSWSRDGKWIYFFSNRSGDNQVWKMPAEGGDSLQVTRKGGEEAFESSDGKFVYYSKVNNWPTSLWKVPVKGGEETQVIESVTPRAFAVSNEGIYFVTLPNAPGACSIQFFNFATGKIEQITEITKSVGAGLTVSPDGRSILYSQLDQGGSDLMLVENFR